MEALDKFIKDMQKESNNIRNRLIIDDIFCISKGTFSKYSDYVEFKQHMISDIRNANDNQITVSGNRYIFTYYVEPLILSEHDFNYIMDKYFRNYNGV